MATKSVPDVSRSLLDLQFHTYSRIIARKHGVKTPFPSDEEIADWTDEQLAAYVEALKDLAHLPPV